MNNNETYPNWMRKFTTELNISDKSSDIHLLNVLNLLFQKPNEKIILLCEGSPYQISLDSNKNIFVKKC